MTYLVTYPFFFWPLLWFINFPQSRVEYRQDSLADPISTPWRGPLGRRLRVTEIALCKSRDAMSYNKLLVAGLEHGFYDFPYIGNFIIPTDFHSIIFQRGRLKPPTRLTYPTLDIDTEIDKVGDSLKY